MDKKVLKYDLISIICIVFGPVSYGLIVFLNTPQYYSFITSIPGTIFGSILGILAIASIPASVIFAVLAKSRAKQLKQKQVFPWIVLIASILYAAVPLITILLIAIFGAFFFGACAVHPSGACT